MGHINHFLHWLNLTLRFQEHFKGKCEIRKRRVYNCIIVCLALLVVGVFICLLLWWDAQMKEREKIIASNSEYVDYSCKDRHLVCLIEGEPMGQYYKDIKSSKYCFRYTSIDGISGKEFVLAEIFQAAPMSFSDHLILQNPEYEVNVLEDWNVKEIELKGINVLKESSDEELIQHLLQALKDTSAIYTDDNYRNEIYDGYTRVDEDGTTLYIQLRFEETESIAWVSELNIYEAEEDSTKYYITLDIGDITEEMDVLYGEVIIDSSNEFAKWVRNK